jgi:1-acyl-sn-glycerol-3-phosphate acyltransferase
MSFRTFFANKIVRWIFKLHVWVDPNLQQIPMEGPMILVGNHVLFLDAPILMTHLQPRKVKFIAKVESWKNPLFEYLFDVWGAIPIRRGEADLSAFQAARKALNAGEQLAIAPEGTRSSDGRLQKGYPGVVLIAARTNAPLLPVVYFGHETYWENLKKFRRTHFNVRVGTPFRLDTDTHRLDREVRQQMTDEIMYQLAALMPPKYRGVYSDLENATEKYLRFEPGAVSSLQQALATPQTTA